MPDNFTFLNLWNPSYNQGIKKVDIDLAINPFQSKVHFTN
jgi:hypothetical protein